MLVRDRYSETATGTAFPRTSWAPKPSISPGEVCGHALFPYKSVFSSCLCACLFSSISFVLIDLLYPGSEDLLAMIKDHPPAVVIDYPNYLHCPVGVDQQSACVSTCVSFYEGYRHDK